MCRPRFLFHSASLLSLAAALAFQASANVRVYSARPQNIEPEKRDRSEVRLPSDGPGLIDFLRKLSPSDYPPERIEQLIAQLGSSKFEERERASKELVAVGISALPHLTRALSSTDGEVVRRAQTCIRDITPAEAMQGMPLEAVRGLVRLRPLGAVEALLRYLPNATNDESLREEIWYGLDSLTVSEGKIDSALLAALKDMVPVRRAAAACIVGHRGNEEQRAEVRKLLADADPWVRLRAAQGLLAAKDKAAIPVLIALLERRPVALAWQAEELLHWLAGDEAPEPTVGSGSLAIVQQCRRAWEAWWQQQGDKIDFVKLDGEPRRPLLLLMSFVGPKESDFWLSGCDGKPRWQLRNVAETIDIHLLSGDRILVAQQGSMRRSVRNPKARHVEDVSGVTERDLEGKIVWQYKGVKDPLVCRRLPNGNTRILGMGPSSVEEVDRDGKRIFLRLLEVRGDSVVPSYPYFLSNGCLFYHQSGNPIAGGGEMDFATGQIVASVGRTLPCSYLPIMSGGIPVCFAISCLFRVNGRIIAVMLPQCLDERSFEVAYPYYEAVLKDRTTPQDLHHACFTEGIRGPEPDRSAQVSA